MADNLKSSCCEADVNTYSDGLSVWNRCVKCLGICTLVEVLPEEPEKEGIEKGEERCRDCKFYVRVNFMKNLGHCEHPDRKEEDRPVWGRWTKNLSGCEVFIKGKFKILEANL